MIMPKVTQTLRKGGIPVVQSIRYHSGAPAPQQLLPCWDDQDVLARIVVSCEIFLPEQREGLLVLPCRCCFCDYGSSCYHLS